LKVIFLWVLYPLIRPFYLLSLILNTLVLSLIIIALSPIDRKGNLVHHIGKFWSLLNLYLPGARVALRGEENIEKGRPYIIMSNHQSLLDPWVLIAKLPLQLRWIIRSGVKKMPVFGYALERMGHVYVDRTKRKGTAASLEMAVQKLKEGSSVVVFPEGTRSRDGQLLKFQKGGAIIAIKTGAAILPVTINGSRFALPKGTLALMPSKIEVIVGNPIDPRMFDEAKKEELMAVVKTAIAKNLDLEYGSLT